MWAGRVEAHPGHMLSNYQISKILVDERHERFAHEAQENRLARAIRKSRRAQSPHRRSH